MSTRNESWPRVFSAMSKRCSCRTIIACSIPTRLVKSRAFSRTWPKSQRLRSACVRYRLIQKARRHDEAVMLRDLLKQRMPILATNKAP